MSSRPRTSSSSSTPRPSLRPWGCTPGCRRSGWSRRQWCGIALSFLGGLGSAAGRHALLGDALALMAGAAWGSTTVTIRGSALAGAPATETLLYQQQDGVVLLLPAAWLTGQWHFEASGAVWAHLAFQALVVSFASLLAWCWQLRRYLPSRLGVFSFLTPLFGVVLGAALLGESLSTRFLAGSALVLAGIALVSAPGRLLRQRLAARRRQTTPGRA